MKGRNIQLRNLQATIEKEKQNLKDDPEKDKYLAILNSKEYFHPNRTFTELTQFNQNDIVDAKMPILSDTRNTFEIPRGIDFTNMRVFSKVKFSAIDDNDNPNEYTINYEFKIENPTLTRGNFQRFISNCIQTLIHERNQQDYNSAIETDSNKKKIRSDLIAIQFDKYGTKKDPRTLLINKEDLIYEKYTRIPTKTHCVIEAMKLTFERFVKAEIKYKAKYPLGMTISDIKDTCQELKRSFVIYDRLGNVIDKLDNNKNNKKVLKLVLVSNDHVQLIKEREEVMSIPLQDVKLKEMIALLSINNIVPEFEYSTQIDAITTNNVRYFKDPFYLLRDKYNVKDDTTTLKFIMENLDIDEYKSYASRNVMNVLKSKWGPIIRNFKEGKDLYSLDFNSFYYNTLKNMDDNIRVPIFYLPDSIQEYKGEEIEPGLYFHNENWNTHHNTTKNDKITHFIVSSFSLPIKKIKETLLKYKIESNDKVVRFQEKLLFNTILGCFHKTDIIANEIHISRTVEEADCLKRWDKSSVHPVGLDLFLTKNTKISEYNHTFKMIIAMILEESHKIINKVRNELQSKGNIVYEIHTDSFFIDSLKDSEYFMKKYNMKIDKKKVNTIIQKKSEEINEKIDPTHKLETPVCLPSIPIEKFINKEQLFELIDNKTNFILTGTAGTGKSYLIEEISKKYKVSKAAFTNEAAENIGGVTIHQLLGLNKDNIKVRETEIEDIIIIDECTQCPFELYDKLNKLDKLIILVGDAIYLNEEAPGQFSPILGNLSNKIYNNTTPNYKDYNMIDLDIIKSLVKININLTDVKRNIGECKPNIVEKIEKDYETIICHSNDLVKKVNNYLSKKIKYPIIQVGYKRFKLLKIVGKKKKYIYQRIHQTNKEEIIFNSLKEIEQYPISFAITRYCCQGQGYNDYLILQKSNTELTLKERYVLNTRRIGISQPDYLYYDNFLFLE